MGTEKLNLIGAQPFETARCNLRQFRLNDAEYIYRNYASSDKVTKYLTWFTHQSIDDSRAFCKFMVDESRQLDKFNWVIVLTEIGEPIGSIGVVSADIEKKTAGLGWCMGEKWWNRGIMTECAEAVIAYLFFVVGFEELTASHDIGNPASGRVMEKNGMKKYGEENVHLDLKDTDTTIAKYRLSREEWFAKNIRF